MKFTDSIRKAYEGMGRSISRFPLTVLFLLAVAVLNGMQIESYQYQTDYARYIFTFLVGGMLSIVGQMLYERFFVEMRGRYLMMGGAVLLTLGYYFIVGAQPLNHFPIYLKTSVALFALMIAFIWIPTIKNDKILFHRSFLSAIKAFFTSILFSGVLAAGISAIFSVTTYLLFDIDYNVLTHLLNLVVSLFAPIYFLSMTPRYPGERAGYEEDGVVVDAEDHLEAQLTVPRFLEILISYIVIPLTAIYTLILVIYLVLNIGGDFWTDNLLEPLLVSYAIIVIVVYLIGCNIENKFTKIFRQVFPKILVPIVLFQTVASILKISEMGITHGRYYVIMFGIFATFSGIIFSLMKPKYNGWIAVALLVLATISIVPPVDAFTVSKNNQMKFLEEKLVANDMLEDNEVVPNPDISASDKVVITKAVEYLDNMDYADEVAYLPEQFNNYNDFRGTFGFERTYSETPSSPQERFESAYFQWEDNPAVEISEFDVMFQQMTNESLTALPNTDFTVDGESYHLEVDLKDDYYQFVLKNEVSEELLVYDTKELYDTIFGEEGSETYTRGNLTLEEATVEVENDQVKMNILVNSITRSSNYKDADVLLFIDIK